MILDQTILRQPNCCESYDQTTGIGKAWDPLRRSFRSVRFLGWKVFVTDSTEAIIAVERAFSITIDGKTITTVIQPDWEDLGPVEEA